MQLVNIRTAEEQIEEGKDSSDTSFKNLDVPDKRSSEVEFADNENKPTKSGKVVVHKMTRPAKKMVPKKAKKVANIHPKGSAAVVVPLNEVVSETDVEMVKQEDSTWSQVSSSVMGDARQTQYATQQVEGASQQVQSTQVVQSATQQVQNATQRVHGATQQVQNATQQVQGAVQQLHGASQQEQCVAQQVQSATQLLQTTVAPHISVPQYNPVVVASSNIMAQQSMGALHTVPAQQPVVIAVNPHQTTSGFQNRIPISSQGKMGPQPSGPPVQMVRSYQQVAPQPVIRFQQPTFVITTPQVSSCTAPSIIIQSQPITTNEQTVSSINPGSMIQIVSNTNNSTVTSAAPQEQPPGKASKGPQPVKIRPKPRTAKRTPSESPKTKQKEQHPIPRTAKITPSESPKTKQKEQEEIDKANKLLEDVRKRISSGEEENAKTGKCGKRKKKDKTKTAKPTAEQQKAAEEKAQEMVEAIKSKLETSCSEKEQSSSGTNDSGSSDKGSDEGEEAMDTSGYFPDLSPSPEAKEELPKEGNKVKPDGQNHNRQESRDPSAVADVMSPSTGGVSTPLTRRVLFQKATEKVVGKEKNESQTETAHQVQSTSVISDNQTTDNVKAQSQVKDNKETEENGMVADQESNDGWAEVVESQAAEIDSQVMESDNQAQSETPSTESGNRILQTNKSQDVPVQEQQSSPCQSTTESESLQNFGSPLARSGVQIQPSQTPSPTAHVQSGQVQTPTSVQSPHEVQSVTVPNSRITFHSPPVSSFPPQLLSKGGANTPSPVTHLNSSKSPKGISALKRFKIGKGAVTRQSPATSPNAPQAQNPQPKTARKLMEGDQSSAGDQGSEQQQESPSTDKQSQGPLVETSIAAPSSMSTSESQDTNQTVHQETNPSVETGFQVGQADTAHTSQENEGGKTVSSPSEDMLLCREPVLSDDDGDELKPLSKEEEEFCEEPMDEEEADDEPMEEDPKAPADPAGDEEESNMQQKMKSENLLADAANATNSEVKEANPQLVSPTASEKSTHSNVCTPPSNKPSSTEPSPPLKATGGDDEDPHSPETEDALTSPELKVKREDARRPSVTFEDSNSMDAFHSNSNTMDGFEEGHEGVDAENEDSNPPVVDGKKKSKSKKMAAKRIKTKLRRDMESTVEMLDPHIISKDPLVSSIMIYKIYVI